MNKNLVAVALPIRSRTAERGLAASHICPLELRCDAEMQVEGLPWLHGELATAAPQPLHLVLHVHNRAGIPIIEGHSTVEMGERKFTFSDLRAIGIEAYAHAPEAQRFEVAQRVWARRTFGTLRLLSVAGSAPK